MEKDKRTPAALWSKAKFNQTLACALARGREDSVSILYELLEYLTGGTGTNASWTDVASPRTMEGDSCRAAEGGIDDAAR